MPRQEVPPGQGVDERLQILAGVGGDDLPAGGGEIRGEEPSQARLVGQHQPRSLREGFRNGRLLLPPDRHVEPVGRIGLLVQGGRPGHRLPLDRIDPVALPLEGVGGQGDPPPPLAGVEGLPVGLDAGRPEPPQGVRAGRPVRLRLARDGAARDGTGCRSGAPGAARASWTARLPGPTSSSTRRGSRSSSRQRRRAKRTVGRRCAAPSSPGRSPPRRVDPGAGDVGEERDARRAAGATSRTRSANGCEGRLHHRASGRRATCAGAGRDHAAPPSRCSQGRRSPPPGRRRRRAPGR